MEDQEKLIAEVLKNKVVNVRYYYYGHSEEYLATPEEQIVKLCELAAIYGQVGVEFVED